MNTPATPPTVPAFTPGPWCVEKPECSIVFAKRGINVARILRGNLSGDEQQANAELIASAPTLHAENRELRAENERLRTALERCLTAIDAGFGKPQREHIKAQARAALNPATK
jgi:hypothetical protein